MDAKDLRNNDVGALGKLLLDLRREQFKMRMQRGSGQPGRPSQIRAVRKDIARIKTVMKEKQAQSGKT